MSATDRSNKERFQATISVLTPLHTGQGELLHRDVDYLIHQHTGRQDLVDARAKSTSLPYDHSREAMDIEAPTLIIWGRNDRTCHFEIGINCLNLVRNSRLVVLKDTGHWSPFEKPAEYNAHVLNFLKGDW